MIIQSQQSEQIKSTLEQLYFQARFDIAFDGCSDFVKARDLLMSFFCEDINKSIAIINSLDFNNPMFAHIITFIPDIVDQMDSFDDQVAFIDCLQNIQKQYPNVDFNKALFYARLNLKSNN